MKKQKTQLTCPACSAERMATRNWSGFLRRVWIETDSTCKLNTRSCVSVTWTIRPETCITTSDYIIQRTYFTVIRGWNNRALQYANSLPNSLFVRKPFIMNSTDTPEMRCFSLHQEARIITQACPLIYILESYRDQFDIITPKQIEIRNQIYKNEKTRNRKC